MINAIIALTEADAAAMVAYREANNGKLPPNMPTGQWVRDIWPSEAGLVTYDVLCASIDDAATLLVALPDSRIYGAWEFDTGEPAYQQHADLVNIMPSSELEQFHLWAGQSTRRYDT